MFHDAVDDPGSLSPEELRERYVAALRDVVETVGVSAAVERAGVDRATVEALAAGDDLEIELEAAAGILSAREGAPPADAIAAEARDDLLMGMSMAVLDVETLASGIDDALEPKEIQQKIEGRFPMTLGEYALLLQYVEQRKP